VGKLLIAWNVWNNYEDLEIGSEIARELNRRTNAFEKLTIISQGGYPDPPSENQQQHLDEHCFINVDERWPLVSVHKKFFGIYRVLEGIANAYRKGIEYGTDFALITNSDAWALDFQKLKALLSRREINKSAVALRVGQNCGNNLNVGSFAPFFDDHFIILNISNCKQLKIFESSWPPKVYSTPFIQFGSMHYLLYALCNEIIPPGHLSAYTFLRDAVNHYGEFSGSNLLPWQYQPSFGFLHANCDQVSKLHPLRASMLRKFKLDSLPKAQRYCSRYSNGTLPIKENGEFVYYRRRIFSKLFAHMLKAKARLQYVWSSWVQKKEILSSHATIQKIQCWKVARENQHILPTIWTSRLP